MEIKLPEFIYHPDPIGTGSIIPAVGICLGCGQARGYLYQGPVYAQEELQGRICPWCIADGTAHDKFNASFTGESAIGGYGQWEEVPVSILETVAYRTPCFIGWQQEQWWTHCSDAAVYIANVGAKELTGFGQQAVDAIARESGYTGEDLGRYMKALKKGSSPTAYLFQCHHCDAFGGYSDSD